MVTDITIAHSERCPTSAALLRGQAMSHIKIMGQDNIRKPIFSQIDVELFALIFIAA